MAIEDTIADLRRKRETIDQALDLLEEIAGGAVAVPVRSTGVATRSVTRASNTSNAEKEARSKKMKDAWARRRLRESEAGAAQPPAAQTAAPATPDEIKEQLAAAAGSPPPPDEVIPVETIPSRVEYTGPSGQAEDPAPQPGRSGKKQRTH